jgi:hypothetical protein
MAEAAAVAETRMKKFPDIPQTAGSSDHEMEMA